MAEHEEPTHYVIDIEKGFLDTLTLYLTEQIGLEDILQACKDDKTGALLLVLEYQYKYAYQVLVEKAREISRVKTELVDDLISPLEADELLKLYNSDMGTYLVCTQLLNNLQAELVSATLNPLDEFDIGAFSTLADYEAGLGIPPLILTTAQGGPL